MFGSMCLLKLCQLGDGTSFNVDITRWKGFVQSEYEKRKEDTGVFLRAKSEKTVVSVAATVGTTPKAASQPMLPHLGSFAVPQQQSNTLESSSSSSGRQLAPSVFVGSGGDSGGASSSSSSSRSAKRQCLPSLSRSETRESLGTKSIGSIGGCSESSLGLEVSQLVTIPTPQGLWKTCRDNLQTCHKNFLIAMIEKADQKYDVLKTQCKHLKQVNVQLTAKNDQLQRQVERLTIEKHSGETNDDDDSALDVKRLGLVRLSVRGTIALGLRKSLALTSAAGFPLCSLLDVSRFTVVKAEIACWAGMVARVRAFNRICQYRLHQVKAWLRRSISQPLASTSATSSTLTDQNQDQSLTQIVAPLPHNASTSPDALPLHDSGQDTMIATSLGIPTHLSVESLCGGVNMMDPMASASGDIWCIGGTEFAGDATNSNIWQNSKLSGLFVTNLLMTHHAKLKSVDAFHGAFSWWRSV